MSYKQTNKQQTPDQCFLSFPVFLCFSDPIAGTGRIWVGRRKISPRAPLAQGDQPRNFDLRGCGAIAEGRWVKNLIFFVPLRIFPTSLKTVQRFKKLRVRHESITRLLCHFARDARSTNKALVCTRFQVRFGSQIKKRNQGPRCT